MRTMAGYISSVEAALSLRGDIAAMSDDELQRKFARCLELCSDPLIAGTVHTDTAEIHGQDLFAEYQRRLEARTAERAVQS